MASALPFLFLPAFKALLGPARPSLYQPAPWQGSLGRCGTCPGHLETQTEHLHERRRWDWRGTIGLIQLSHSPNFSGFHCTRCRAHFKDWQVKGIMLFFLSKTREAITMTSHHPPLCYQSSLFTRENFTFESIYPLLNVREKHKTIKKKNFKLLDTPSTQKLPSLIFEVHFLLYFFTRQSIIYFEIISYYLI